MENIVGFLDEKCLILIISEICFLQNNIHFGEETHNYAYSVLKRANMDI